jgi:UDPglucose 6-dehydrogenase
VVQIAQIGNGFVGSALHKSFKERGVDTVIYDKFQKVGKIEDILGADIIFFCLPTPYVEGHGFDLGAIQENLKFLAKLNFKGICVIKSTIEPGTARRLEEQYGLRICHNPEFLSEKTAFEDFDNQEHIVIGINKESKRDADVISLYRDLYPDAKISICKTEESEAMKLFCNNFYAMKVQIFNEFYFLCQKIGADFYEIKDLMLRNDWVNPMHTQVPGGDGEISYGGHCFPKDTKALCHFMKILGSPHGILQACIIERDSMRDKKLE